MAAVAVSTAVFTRAAQWPASLNSPQHRPQVPLARIGLAQRLPAVRAAHRAVVQAEYRRGGGGSDFFAGFVVGGVVFGALGYLIAPQLTKSISEVAGRERNGAPKKPAKYLEDEDTFEDYRKSERTAEREQYDDASLSAADLKTRKTLVEKIAQLNAAIDNISAQLSADEKLDTVNEAELEPAT